LSEPADPHDPAGGEESRFAEYLQAAPDAALVLDTDGHVLFANDAAIDLFGFERDEFRGYHFGWPLATDREADIDIITGREAKVVSMRAREIEWAGRPAIIASFRDVTAVRTARVDLARSEARFRAAFQSAPAGLAVCKPDGTITMVNPSLSRLAQRSEEELIGESISTLLSGDDAERELGQRRRLLAGEADSFSFDVGIVSRKGERPGRLNARRADSGADADEAGSAIVYQVVDLTERRAVERRLRYEAEHDDLTRLRSRGSFLEELERTIAECRRYDTTAGLLLIDVDRLKPINDRLGHAAGDRALRRVAGEIADRVRSSDVTGRLGGDEFAVVLPRAEPADIEALATALVEVVETSESEAGAEIEEGAQTTVSIGAVKIDADMTDADQALGEADAAMYEAKRRGGNRAVSRLGKPG
jgi:diguanylate cyclase (GGDEF)-like protein/PAS domain S-box-containing protein